MVAVSTPREHQTEFPLKGFPNSRFWVIVSTATAIGIALIGVAPLALGEGSLSGALIWCASAVVFGLMTFFGFRAMGRGIARLSDSGIVVQRALGRQAARWEHVSDVRIEETSLQNRLVGADERIVSIAFNRALRWSGIQASATYGKGPALFVRSLRIKVDHPETFVSTLKSYLGSTEAT